MNWVVFILINKQFQYLLFIVELPCFAIEINKELIFTFFNALIAFVLYIMI